MVGSTDARLRPIGRHQYFLNHATVENDTVLPKIGELELQPAGVVFINEAGDAQRTALWTWPALIDGAAVFEQSEQEILGKRFDEVEARCERLGESTGIRLVQQRGLRDPGVVDAWWRGRLRRGARAGGHWPAWAVTTAPSASCEQAGENDRREHRGHALHAQRSCDQPGTPICQSRKAKRSARSSSTWLRVLPTP